MDYNKAFLAYETIEGALCQTTDKRISQKQAAVEAIRKIGLNQIREIDPMWFDDENIKEMFFMRLNLLKNIQNDPEKHN